MVKWTEGEYQLLQARQAGQKAKGLGRSRARTASGRVEKVHRHGMVFDSKREADAYDDLKAREMAGEIRDIQVQRPFAIVINGFPICTYIADFTFLDKAGKVHVIDAKGWKTEMYRLKKKLLRACYGHAIEEV